MFTGIIEATAHVLEKSPSGLALERPKSFDDLKIGSSIAVSGVCLSVVAFDEESMSFDMVETTLKKTKLGSLKSGDLVNLERAMKADARLEGHIVQGHVEGVGKVSARISAPNSPRAFSAPTPNPSPGSSATAVASDWPGEGGSGQFNRFLGRIMRGIGRFRFPVRSTVRNAQGMRKNPTPAEEKLWGALRAKKIDGFYFRRQRPVGAYIVDFYCDDLKLAIEVDGGIHQDPGVHEFDEEREFYLQQRGVTTIRYTNEQVLHHFDQTLDSIRKQCRDASLPRLTTSERSERGVSGEGSRVGAMTTVAGGVRGGGKDGDGQTVGAGDRARSAMLTLRLSPQLLAQIIPHGSIAIDGVSLTVADVSDDRITVALIPHTLEHTTLGLLQAGDTVNIETDMLLRLHAKGKGHA